MADIKQLPQSVVNKIAAGEVIERPASVVKELLENAVDAGATRIDLSLEQGGVELVRVVDNGSGITAEQLPLAVAAHATSKICDADDLFRVGTLGFRGEALASIAEISKLVMRSRPAESAAGAEIVVSGGHSQGVAPCGCAVGTSVEVHNLFYNTPVRRKFLRTAQTEMGHATEAFTRLALANNEIHFTLRSHDKTIYDLPPASDWTQRIAAFFGGELADALIAVESSDAEVRLTGYVAHPSHTRSHARMQYLLLNGRTIRDRSLQHALGEAYRGLVLTGRYPVAFLRIEMPPAAVDVNVHPTKQEVRFQDSGRLYSQLLGTIRTKFLSVDLTAKLRPGGTFAGVAGLNAAENSGSRDPAGAVDEQFAAQQRQELVAWAKGAGKESAFGAQGSGIGSHHFAERKPLELVRIDRPIPAARQLETPHGNRPATLPSAPDPLTAALRSPPAMQVHDRYLIAESADGVVVIDQHALHERILYEELRERVLAGTLEAQRLLVPETVDLSPTEAATAIANQELLRKLGVEISAFGGDTILVTSYPAMLAKFRPTEVLREVVDALLAGGKTPERRDLLDDLLHMISCKAAIKAGDRLSAEEVAALVELRHLAQDSHHCPHGRPTALVFTREELDRQFLRT